MSYTVYILYTSLHDQIYIGYTSNLLQRFKSHQQLGNDWTARYRPWTVVYCIHFDDKKIALAQEKKLKQFRQRIRIRKLIEQQFHTQGFINWNDMG